MTRTSEPPRVFISYSRDSDQHCRRVLELAQVLRKRGIDAWVDLFERGIPEGGFPAWMARQVRQADTVLVVCTERYFRRFEGDDQSGYGVRFESTLLHGALVVSPNRRERFMPVLLDGTDERFVPPLLAGAGYFR
ncbi:MAG: toll/interleukin-1 receptor domain-containing protein, partial [Myxococcota bacterium]